MVQVGEIAVKFQKKSEQILQLESPRFLSINFSESAFVFALDQSLITPSLRGRSRKTRFGREARHCPYACSQGRLTIALFPTELFQLDIGRSRRRNLNLRIRATGYPENLEVAVVDPMLFDCEKHNCLFLEERSILGNVLMCAEFNSRVDPATFSLRILRSIDQQREHINDGRKNSVCINRASDHVRLESLFERFRSSEPFISRKTFFPPQHTRDLSTQPCLYIDQSASSERALSFPFPDLE